jgi:hypothetical protein
MEKPLDIHERMKKNLNDLRAREIMVGIDFWKVNWEFCPVTDFSDYVNK